MFETLSVEERPMKECKPDPEEMLKNIRGQIEIINKAESLLEQFVKLPLYMHSLELDKSFLLIFGHLKVKRMEAEHEEKRWLREIDETQP